MQRIHRESPAAGFSTGTVRVYLLTLDGRLRMKHSFYHAEEDNVVEATLVGYVDFETARPRIRTLRIVPNTAAYGGGTFGVAVRSVQIQNASADTSMAEA